MLAEIYRRNPDRFRLFSPDETNSNRLGAVFDVSDRAFMERIEPGDVQISHDGRVMEVLSEHNCHGWLEGYTLTGGMACSPRTKRLPWSVRPDRAAQQMARGRGAAALAGPDPQFQRAVDLHCLAE